MSLLLALGFGVHLSDYLTYQSYISKIHNLELILDYRNMSNKLGLSIKDYRYNQESQQVISEHNWLTFGDRG